MIDVTVIVPLADRGRKQMAIHAAGRFYDAETFCERQQRITWTCRSEPEAVRLEAALTRRAFNPTRAPHA
ncbi:MAG: hypothetical protein AAGG72_01845 [Pseudomonadota bacterium]